MNTSKNVNVTASFPLPAMLGLLFIALKLTNVIAWSWLWVLAPFWIPLSLVGLILLVVGVLYLFSK